MGMNDASVGTLRDLAVNAESTGEAMVTDLPSDWALVDHFERDGKRYFVVATGPGAKRDPRLSAREQQVAALAKLGYSNKAIGWELDVTASTVATHLTQICKKLNVAGRVPLIRLLRNTQ